MGCGSVAQCFSACFFTLNPCGKEGGASVRFPKLYGRVISELISFVPIWQLRLDILKASAALQDAVVALSPMAR